MEPTHIFILDAEEAFFSEKIIDFMKRRLPQSYIAYAESCKNSGRQAERVLAYSLLSYGLEKIFCELEMPALEISKNGKPGFSNTNELCFSVSHSHGVIAVALSRGENISLGVDVQKVETVEPEKFSRICDRFTKGIDSDTCRTFLGVDDLKNGKAGIVLHTLCLRENNNSYELYPSEKGFVQTNEPYPAELWTSAEAVLKMEGGGFSSLERLKSISSRASIYSLSLKINEESYSLSLAKSKENFERT